MVIAVFLWSIYAAAPAPLDSLQQSLPPIQNFDDGADQDPFYDLLDPDTDSDIARSEHTPKSLPPTWEEI